MSTDRPGDFKKYLQGLGHSTTTIHGHLSALKYLTTWSTKENLEVDQLSYTELLSFTKYCQAKGAGKTTVNKYLLSIKHYFNHLIEQGKATENPAQYLQLKGVARKKLYDTFTPLELESIYHRYCNKDFSSKRYSTLKKVNELEHLRNKVMVGMLVYQGLRSDEIIHLRMEDVKLRKGMIEIPEIKNSNGREMKLEACQIMDLHHYMTEGRKEILGITQLQTEKLFTSIGSSPGLHNTLHKLNQQLISIEPRIKNLKQIRASVITKWLKLYNLRQVQYMAGHKWISSTEEYLQNEMEGLQEEINKYHPLG
ncbi:site-specific integrase [Microcystis sp. M112S1]|jgi:site-specific recombinase XerD|uniref:tyrosine-type recombinase/integrase n=1 Tax=Microcystis sp. M112S1 TaxID=2771103 RepID=UPI0025852681|nr:site-specific integrase [Microcystis sp. M112S1]MCA4900298.1 tyrosine-type recombinase/integrase [Cytophagales bacterium]MCA2951406.1 tyrosine-type recombinase/integrase [Microcystis sp. M112S1]MCA6366216.1 tyrosine-type recombinase/integrase [Cytophagales bacterium]MCA6372848.1 tyrosine-type recombinase/integrase [Cytophagales bacterium]MCA6385870.1 tyrosine-type recombinase/integrase [Cytophagales bacterium]